MANMSVILESRLRAESLRSRLPNPGSLDQSIWERSGEGSMELQSRSSLGSDWPAPLSWRPRAELDGGLVEEEEEEGLGLRKPSEENGVCDGVLRPSEACRLCRASARDVCCGACWEACSWERLMSPWGVEEGGRLEALDTWREGEGSKTLYPLKI